MKFVRPNPSKGTWKLPQYTLEDGTKEIRTGYDGGMPWSLHQDTDGRYYTAKYQWNPETQTREEVSRKYYTIDFIDNFIFTAALRYVSLRRRENGCAFEFVDDDDNVTHYTMSDEVFDDMMKKVGSGKLKTRTNGAVEATWTFRKPGGVIYVYLVEDA